MRIFLKTLADTQKLATCFARILQSGDVLALYGELGAGKTTFARALIQALCGKNIDVPSPTFTLVQTYDAGATLGDISHFDFYRLKSPEEVVELGFEDALLSGIVLMEWPEKIGGFMPRDYLKIDFSVIQDDVNAREVSVEIVGEKWQTRLADLESCFKGQTYG